MAESYGLVPCSRVSPIDLLENIPYSKTAKQWNSLVLRNVNIKNDFFYSDYYLKGDIHDVGMQL